jgi:hypothetical protein
VAAKLLGIRLTARDCSNKANNISGRRHLRRLCPLLWACLWFFQLHPVEAAQRNLKTDNQVREAVEQVVELMHPGANIGKILDRKDLNEELSQIAGKTMPLVHCYSFYDADSSADDGSTWVVVSGNSPLASDELYSFESSDDVEQSSQKFNQLLSHLALSIPNEKATSMARFFLDCCVRGRAGEAVGDENSLRHSVERYYIAIYGDVWRALEAYTQWWQDYEKAAVHLTPVVVEDGSVRRITLERLTVIFGAHPQLEQWEIAVSDDGSVRVLAVESIFPKKSRWLSHAFRSTIEPQNHLSEAIHSDTTAAGLSYPTVSGERRVGASEAPTVSYSAGGSSVPSVIRKLLQSRIERMGSHLVPRLHQ